MGFKPRSRLKKYYNIKPAQFLYPDENVSVAFKTSAVSPTDIPYILHWYTLYPIKATVWISWICVLHIA